MKFCTAKKGTVQSLIAYKVDRISRNIADYHIIRGTLKKYGVEIRSVTEFFEDTPAGRFMENIIANVGQFDNDVRAERSLGGMREATEEGRYVWKAPLGYTNVKINGKSTIAPNAQAPMIRKIFELIASRLYSTNSIRFMIAKDGLVNRKGKPINVSYFYELVRNPLYKGVIEKFGNEYTGTFDAIVPVDLFDNVQGILRGKENIVSHYLHENPDFPLRRFVTDEAGNKITGYWSQGKRLKYPYYSFQRPNTTIRKEVLEQKFMDFLAGYGFDTKHFDRMVYHLKDQFEYLSKTETDGREEIEIQISHLNKRIDSLIALKADGTISLNTFTDRIHQAEADIEQLQRLLKTSTNHEDYNIDDLMTFARAALKEPYTVWKNSPFTLKQELQVFDFPKGVVFDGANCRTPQICRLFRLKSDIDNEIFSIVPSSEKRKNTPKGIVSPPVNHINTKAYWEMIVEELLELKHILSGKKPEVNQ